MITSRSLDDLKPFVKALAVRHIFQCGKAGIDLLIYCTYRDNEAQNVLFAQGRTTPGEICTGARGGESGHNYKLAYDCVPLLHGKAMWGDKKSYMLIGAIGKSIGLEWAGDWHNNPERAHFQYLGGLTIADLQAGKQFTNSIYAFAR